jgi:hypothetical protein
MRHNLIKALPQNLPSGTEERYDESVRVAGFSPEIRTENLPNVSVESYRLTNPLIGVTDLIDAGNLCAFPCHRSDRTCRLMG